MTLSIEQRASLTGGTRPHGAPPRERVSLHRAIYNDIVDRISTGRYGVGQMLPSEAELERAYGASRTPIRQALKQLETDGFIYRHQGRGSFVANENPFRNWSLTTGFQQHYAENWERISAQTLSVGTEVHAVYSGVLGLDSDTPLTRVARLRLFDGSPVLYLQHYLHPEVSPEIFAQDQTFLSKDRLVQERLGIKVGEIEESLQAILAPAEVSDALGIDAGSPVLRILRTSTALRFGPLDVTEYYVRTDLWPYVTNYRSP